MPAFFSLNLVPSVTRDNASIEAFNTTLNSLPNVTREFDSQAVANTTLNAVAINLRGYNLTGFNNVSLSCNAVATKRIINSLDADSDLISDNGAIRTTSAFSGVTTSVSFLGGRLIDNIVNARYGNAGYVNEGYVVDEPASKVFATLQAESDITILLDVFVVSTLSVDPTFTFRPTINLSSNFSLTCSVTGVQLIEMNAFGNAAVNVDYIRYRENSANIVSQSTLTANADFTADGIQLVASEATLTADIAKILGGIVVGNLPATFTLVCVGDDLILDEAQVFVEVQSQLTALPGRRHFGVINLVANSGVVNVFTVEHIEEYVYIIPAEGWEYKIEAESRVHIISGETRVRKINGESRVKKIAAESRIHIIT